MNITVDSLILNDEMIEARAEDGLIEPFIGEQQEEGVVSYGLGHMGYDIRASEKAEVFRNKDAGKINPKHFDPSNLKNARIHANEYGKYFEIPGNSFALTHSVERIDMPEDLIGIVVGKSTYARCGVNAYITPLEPGWKGYITLEIANTAPLPANVYVDEGVAQILFFKGASPSVSYADKEGKYQNQPKDITHPTVVKGDD